ncbi:AraC family ligand binding domain-containing protein, partial [Spirochaetota bacterium]
MKENKYERITFDKISKAPIYETVKEITGKNVNIFPYLNILCHLLPEVIGVFRYTSDDEELYKTRFHSNVHELVFIVDGKGSFNLVNKRYSVQKGDVLLIKPKNLHRIVKGSEFECIVFHYTFSKLEELELKLSFDSEHERMDPFLNFLIKNYPKIHKITLNKESQIIPKVCTLHKEYKSQYAGSEMLSSLYFLEILILLSRNFLYRKKHNFPLDTYVQERDRIIAFNILRFIDRNYNSNIDINNMLSNYCLHPN